MQVGEEIELQKSVFGLSLKELAEQAKTTRKETLNKTLRKSVQPQALHSLKKQECPPLVEEFFIIGIETYKTSKQVFEQEAPVQP